MTVSISTIRLECLHFSVFFNFSEKLMSSALKEIIIINLVNHASLLSVLT